MTTRGLAAVYVSLKHPSTMGAPADANPSMLGAVANIASGRPARAAASRQTSLTEPVPTLSTPSQPANAVSSARTLSMDATRQSGYTVYVQSNAPSARSMPAAARRVFSSATTCSFRPNPFRCRISPAAAVTPLSTTTSSNAVVCARPQAQPENSFFSSAIFIH